MPDLVIDAYGATNDVWAIDTNQNVLQLQWKTGAFVAAGDRLMVEKRMPEACKIRHSIGTR